MKIAIVSTDKKTVNEHFGKAESFLICEMTEHKIEILEERPVAPYASGNPNHPFEPDKLEKALTALSGCQKIYCTQIGDKPAGELLKAGIEPVVYEGSIADIS